MKNTYEQTHPVRPARKIGMTEMRAIIGALTTEYSPDAADAYRRQLEERNARESLTAYYVGRMTGAIAVEHGPQTEEEVEQVLRYKELVDQHTLAMLEHYATTEPSDADVLIHPAFNGDDDGQTPLGQLAS